MMGRSILMVGVKQLGSKWLDQDYQKNSGCTLQQHIKYTVCTIDLVTWCYVKNNGVHLRMLKQGFGAS